MSTIFDYGTGSIYGASWIFLAGMLWPGNALKKISDAIIVTTLLIVIEIFVNQRQTFLFTGVVIAMLCAGFVVSYAGGEIFKQFHHHHKKPRFQTDHTMIHHLSQSNRTRIRTIPSHHEDHVSAEAIFGDPGVRFGESLCIIMASLSVASWDTNHLSGEVASIFPLIIASAICTLGSLMMMDSAGMNFVLGATGGNIAIFVLLCVNSFNQMAILLIMSLVSSVAYVLLVLLYCLWVLRTTTTTTITTKKT
jgi:hypothetical protein